MKPLKYWAIWSVKLTSKCEKRELIINRHEIYDCFVLHFINLNHLSFRFTQLFQLFFECRINAHGSYHNGKTAFIGKSRINIFFMMYLFKFNISKVILRN